MHQCELCAGPLSGGVVHIASGARSAGASPPAQGQSVAAPSFRPAPHSGSGAEGKSGTPRSSGSRTGRHSRPLGVAVVPAALGVRGQAQGAGLG